MKIGRVIVGAGGFARELSWLLSDSGFGAHCFLVDRPYLAARSINDVPVLCFDEIEDEAFRGVPYLVSNGRPGNRRDLAQRMDNLGADAFVVVHPSVSMSRRIELGKGTAVCAGSRLTTNITIGEHVHVNLNCTIGHDVVIGDFVTLSPGVHVSGNVRIESGAFIGTGAVIINGSADAPIIVGRDATIAAGACVTKEVAPGSMVAGVPAVRKR